MFRSHFLLRAKSVRNSLRGRYSTHKSNDKLAFGGLVLTGAVFLSTSLWATNEYQANCAGVSDVKKYDALSSGPIVSEEKIFIDENEKDFAFIVTGAGTAGCLTAYLLAKWLEERNVAGKVLLLDRGPDFDGRDGPDPMMDAWFTNWGTFGEAHTAYRHDGSEYPVIPTSHNGIGGCGTHDTRISFVMRPEQRKRVAEKMGWTFEQLTLYFQAVLDMIPLLPSIPGEEEYYTKMIESLTNPENPHHLHRLIDNFANNGNSAVLGDRDVYKRAEPVMNTIGQPLLAMYNNELRWTSAYLLRPGNHRPNNLVVVPNAIVDKVVFDEENKRAVGVRFAVGSQQYRANVTSSGGEIALTSGAFGNVGILQRSGIGPKAVLDTLQVPVVGDNPMVGRGIDHPEASIMYEWIKEEKDLPRGGVNGWPLVVFATTQPEEKTKKTLEFMTHFGAGYAEPYTAFPSVLATPNCMQPNLNTGYLATINSTRPNDILLLTHLDQREDWEVIAKGIQQMEKVFAQAQKDNLVGKRLLPPPEVNMNDLQDVTEYVKENHFTVFHWACTTRAGKNPEIAAADEHFRIRKSLSSCLGESTNSCSKKDSKPEVICNLRVGSAASLPELSEANPHLSIGAFSFALAHEMVKSFLNDPTAEPKELKKAEDSLRATNGQLSVRRDGEEYPLLGRVAVEYFAEWKREHD